MLYYGDRIIIPDPLRQEVLEKLHGAHQGSSSMMLRANRNFFWPGMTGDIKKYRNMCLSCNECQPSNPNLPPKLIEEPLYPFQDICVDYFNYAGHKYGVMVCRFSGWPAVWKANDTSFSNWLRTFCSMFGIPEIISTDGGPEFMSGEVKTLLKQYGIRHRVSSAYNPHSNSRAEIGVKTVKRLLQENVDSDGSIENSRFLNALLTYKNTPDRDMALTPAEIVLGKPLNDFFPNVTNGLLSNHQHWKDKLSYREAALSTRRKADGEKWSEHTKLPLELEIGDHVSIQNGQGNNTLRWEKKGVIVSIEGFDKYGIKVDGSRRLTFRNRKHLRKFVPMYMDPDFDYLDKNTELEKNYVPEEMSLSDPDPGQFSHVEELQTGSGSESNPDIVTMPKVKSRSNSDPFISMDKPNITLEPIDNVDNTVIETENSNVPNRYVKPVNDPIATPETVDVNFDNEMNTPALRRSSRSNKGVNNKLRNDFELYNLCCHCVNHEMYFGSYRNAFPTPCDGGEGG